MSVSRLTLPDEFYDVTSAGILLPPEPEYLWAKALFYGVRGAELVAAGALPFGPQANNKLSSSGAPIPDFQQGVLMLNESELSVSGMITTELFPTAQRGHTVRINRLVFADTTYTEASRRITRGVITTTGVDITDEQVSITIQRQGGPYDQTNSRVAPHYIEDFDANRSVHDLSQRVLANLRRDRMKYIDTVVANYFCTNSASTAYVYAGDPTSALSSDATAFLSQGDRPFSYEQLVRSERVAKVAKIRPFPSGRYLAVISPKQEEQLKTNRAFRDQTTFQKEKNPVFSNFLGTIGMTDIYVSSTNPTTTTSGITVQLGALFGPGALGYAQGSPCEVVPDDNTNFRQRVGVIWRADEGFELLDNRFLVSLRSD